MCYIDNKKGENSRGRRRKIFWREKDLKPHNDGSYKYLGVFEADDLKRSEMKEKIKKEYKKRVRKVLETKLNGNNLIKAINTWAVAVIRYSAPFLDWNKDELLALDRRTKKLMTMHRALHPKSNVDRIYLSRKEGGRGLISIEDTTRTAILGLQKYIQESEEKLTIAARKPEDISETAKGFKSRRAKQVSKTGPTKRYMDSF